MNTDAKLISLWPNTFSSGTVLPRREWVGWPRLQACPAGRCTNPAGSKTAFITAVLTQLGQRFLQLLRVSSVDALFEGLERWIREEGARGCLLRTQGEAGGDVAEISEAVLSHKIQLSEKVRLVVCSEMGDKGDELAEQIPILNEGVTAAAVYRGVAAVATARSMAALLLVRARS